MCGHVRQGEISPIVGLDGISGGLGWRCSRKRGVGSWYTQKEGRVVRGRKTGRNSAERVKLMNQKERAKGCTVANDAFDRDHEAGPRRLREDRAKEQKEAPADGGGGSRKNKTNRGVEEIGGPGAEMRAQRCSGQFRYILHCFGGRCAGPQGWWARFGAITRRKGPLEAALCPFGVLRWLNLEGRSGAQAL